MEEQVALPLPELPELSFATLNGGPYHANSVTSDGMLEDHGNYNLPPFPWIEQQSTEPPFHTRPDFIRRGCPPEPNKTLTPTSDEGAAKPRKLVVLKYRQSPRSPGLHLFHGSQSRGKSRSGAMHHHASRVEALLLLF